MFGKCPSRAAYDAFALETEASVTMNQKNPLDDVEYLARSPNRVDLLEAIGADSYTRGELRELTDITQPTLGRILDGFERRGWIRKSGKSYRLSRLGRVLADEFGQLLDTVETVQQLAELEARLPTDQMDFDFRLFREATITTPRHPDVFAHLRRAEELVSSAAHTTWLTGNMYLDSIPKQRELLLERNQVQEVVISKTALDVALARPETVTMIRELLESGRMTIYRFEGTVSLSVGLADETAIMVPYDDNTVPCALIDTENDVIRDWVSKMIHEYRAQAELLTLTDLPE